MTFLESSLNVIIILLIRHLVSVLLFCDYLKKINILKISQQCGLNISIPHEIFYITNLQQLKFLQNFMKIQFKEFLSRIT